jgi:hypothetical protein
VYTKDLTVPASFALCKIERVPARAGLRMSSSALVYRKKWLAPSTGRAKRRTYLDVESGTSSMDDDVDTLDCLVEDALLRDALRQYKSLDFAGVLAPVLADPRVGLLLLAKRKTNGVSKVEETKGDSGTNEAGSASDKGEDGGGGVAGSGHGERAVASE